MPGRQNVGARMQAVHPGMHVGQPECMPGSWIACQAARMHALQAVYMFYLYALTNTGVEYIKKGNITLVK